MYYEDHPIVLEREAGFRPRDDQCYKEISIPNPQPPNYCWEYPCSTIRPCKAKENEKENKNKKDSCDHGYVIAP